LIISLHLIATPDTVRLSPDPLYLSNKKAPRGYYHKKYLSGAFDLPEIKDSMENRTKDRKRQQVGSGGVAHTDFRNLPTGTSLFDDEADDSSTWRELNIAIYH
jgi:hypothetical protein